MDVLFKGTQFINLTELKQACQEYAVQNAFEFKTLRYSKTHYEIAYKVNRCDWRLYSRPVNGANIILIQKYTAIHKCFDLNHAGNKQAMFIFIANKISEKLQQQHG